MPGPEMPSDLHGLLNIFHFTFCCSFKDDLSTLFKIIFGQNSKLLIQVKSPGQ